ncbi:hypothetical protein [Vibrio aerogenes]|uniref:hypothetical protein n=1 Tax=Vibrio aerogenes TaxID=92172 RepID=UPI000936E7E3|nr:hypothetical protein [Vibrio aerogenes]
MDSHIWIVKRPEEVSSGDRSSNKLKDRLDTDSDSASKDSITSHASLETCQNKYSTRKIDKLKYIQTQI